MKEPKLTPEQYTAAGGNKCPYCEAQAVSPGFEKAWVDDMTGAFRPFMNCDDCGAEWGETYELSGYVETNYEEVETDPDELEGKIFRVMRRSTRSYQGSWEGSLWNEEVLYIGNDANEARCTYHEHQPADRALNPGSPGDVTLFQMLDTKNLEDIDPGEDWKSKR